MNRNEFKDRLTKSIKNVYMKYNGNFDSSNKFKWIAQISTVLQRDIYDNSSIEHLLINELSKQVESHQKVIPNASVLITRLLKSRWAQMVLIHTKMAEFGKIVKSSGMTYTIQGIKDASKAKDDALLEFITSELLDLYIMAERHDYDTQAPGRWLRFNKGDRSLSHHYVANKAVTVVQSSATDKVILSFITHPVMYRKCNAVFELLRLSDYIDIERKSDYEIIIGFNDNDKHTPKLAKSPLFFDNPLLDKIESITKSLSDVRSKLVELEGKRVKLLASETRLNDRLEILNSAKNILGE